MFSKTLQNMQNWMENMTGNIGKISEANSIPPERQSMSHKEREASYQISSSKHKRNKSPFPRNSSEDSDIDQSVKQKIGRPVKELQSVEQEIQSIEQEQEHVLDIHSGSGRV
jgi:hypothetical protein